MFNVLTHVETKMIIERHNADSDGTALAWHDYQVTDSYTLFERPDLTYNACHMGAALARGNVSVDRGECFYGIYPAEIRKFIPTYCNKVVLYCSFLLSLPSGLDLPKRHAWGSLQGHKFERDNRFPRWHGWHAARRGLGTNLYRLGVPDKVIQAILRHSNVNVTLGYYIKPQAEDVIAAMSKFEAEMAAHDVRDSNSNGTVNRLSGAMPKSVN